VVFGVILLFVKEGRAFLAKVSERFPIGGILKDMTTGDAF
jgi:hypothetical protein